MYIEGVDALDNNILNQIRDNARLSYSEIGERVGLSRIAVKNRMESMEKKGIIQGYKTVIDSRKVPEGLQFIIDVETHPEYYREVKDVLGTDRYLRQIYATTGNCRMHAIGFAPNVKTIEVHTNNLYRNTKGIRRLEWNLLMSTIKDVDGGVEYVRYAESEHLESRENG